MYYIFWIPKYGPGKKPYGQDYSLAIVQAKILTAFINIKCIFVPKMVLGIPNIKIVPGEKLII